MKIPKPLLAAAALAAIALASCADFLKPTEESKTTLTVYNVSSVTFDGMYFAPAENLAFGPTNYLQGRTLAPNGTMTLEMPVDTLQISLESSFLEVSAYYPVLTFAKGKNHKWIVEDTLPFMADGHASIIVQNNSSATFDVLNIDSSASDVWTDNRLTTSALKPNESFQMTMLAGTYDIRVRVQSAATFVEKYAWAWNNNNVYTWTLKDTAPSGDMRGVSVDLTSVTSAVANRPNRTE